MLAVAMVGKLPYRTMLAVAVAIVGVLPYRMLLLVAVASVVLDEAARNWGWQVSSGL